MRSMVLRRRQAGVIAVLVLFAIPGWTQESDRQSEDFLKTDLMGVFAHPDDESGIASLLAKYARGDGKILANVYCTRGEGGGNMVGTQSGRALGILRERELRDALEILGVRHIGFLDCEDFFYTESIAATLEKWDKEQALENLTRYYRVFRPDIVITMNPTPRSGQHGHHQAAGLLATEAFWAAADPNRFPDHLEQEGLSTWQVRKLFYTGATGEHVSEIPVTTTLQNGRTPAAIAVAAMRNHRSQAFGRIQLSPWMTRPRQLSLALSVLDWRAEDTDIFAGISEYKDRAARRALKIGGRGNSGATSPSIAFEQRPAYEAFMKWAPENGVADALGAIQGDLPIPAGIPTRITLKLDGERGAFLNRSIELHIDEGWSVAPKMIDLEGDILAETLSSNGSRNLALTVSAPEGARSPAILTAAVTGDNSEIQKSKIELSPKPVRRIPRASHPLLVDAEDNWDQLTRLEIAHDSLVQGVTESKSDSSATVSLGYDNAFFYIATDVRDEQIVSNIAANDIKGHWRSDSVEILIDPVGGSENTLNCFKLGIFPFDTMGRVRAARDADANQGPVERTAPGTELFSTRTDSGYRLRVAIPWKAIGTRPSPGTTVGFNVIIYDGDKADAEVGENINESRIAWAVRSGVQGRPEDWGRLVIGE